MIPRLYAIIDVGLLTARGIALNEFASELQEAGVTLIQYRDKTSGPQEILQAVAEIRGAYGSQPCQLILNDRPDLAVLARADGVHVGQDDLSPADARAVIGPNRIVGVSTHSDNQIRATHLTPADYIAIGPVFATASKLNPDPVIGLEGVRRARALTTKPLIAIGGITRENARSVIDAGADSVAIISGLIAPNLSTANVARDFLHILR
jgi:thiamine-phosphate pyrophosphorylase